MTRRRRLAHLTAAQLVARSRKGWQTRRAASTWTKAQRAHYREFYNTGLRRRLVAAGFCRSCCRKREPSRRDVSECVRCAKVSAARAARQVRHWIPRNQQRTAA